MRRRTLFGLAAAARAWAQTATFPGRHGATLKRLAAELLPSGVNAGGVAERFVQWVRGYRSGADLEHGYGFPRLRSKPASPAPAYLAQLDELEKVFARLPPREAIEKAIAKVPALPNAPNGTHVITDLMSFYFRSSEANDLCYERAIGRDGCRSLEGSQNPPPPLRAGA